MSRASVVLRPVYLIEFDELLKDKTTTDTLRKRAAFAEWLAFGKEPSI